MQLSGARPAPRWLISQRVHDGFMPAVRSSACCSSRPPRIAHAFGSRHAHTRCGLRKPRRGRPASCKARVARPARQADRQQRHSKLPVRRKTKSCTDCYRRHAGCGRAVGRARRSVDSGAVKVEVGAAEGGADLGSSAITAAGRSSTPSTHPKSSRLTVARYLNLTDPSTSTCCSSRSAHAAYQEPNRPAEPVHVHHWPGSTRDAARL